MISELMVMPSFYFLISSFLLYVLRGFYVGVNLYKKHIIEKIELSEDLDINISEILIAIPLVFCLLISFVSVLENMQTIYGSNEKDVVEVIEYYKSIATDNSAGSDLNQRALYALMDVKEKLESNSRLNQYELDQIIERKTNFEKSRIFLENDTSN